MPAPSGRLASGQTATWTVLRDGEYRVYASPGLASHPWFDKPVYVGLLDRPDAARFPIRVGEPRVPEGLEIAVDGAKVELAAGRVGLRGGQKLTAKWVGDAPVGVFFLPGSDAIWFRNPPPGVTLEAAYPRVTHWPDLLAE